MKRKQFSLGIIIVMIGVYLSARSYNNLGEPVHDFTMKCLLQPDYYVRGYSWLSLQDQYEWCTHNLGLSLVLYAILGVGVFLVYMSKEKNNVHSTNSGDGQNHIHET